MGFRRHLVKYFEIELLLVKHLKKLTVQKFWMKRICFHISVDRNIQQYFKYAFKRAFWLREVEDSYWFWFCQDILITSKW